MVYCCHQPEGDRNGHERNTAGAGGTDLPERAAGNEAAVHAEGSVGSAVRYGSVCQTGGTEFPRKIFVFLLTNGI